MASSFAKFVVEKRAEFNRLYGDVTLDFVLDGPWDVDGHRTEFVQEVTTRFPSEALGANNLFSQLLLQCCKPKEDVKADEALDSDSDLDDDGLIKFYDDN